MNRPDRTRMRRSAPLLAAAVAAAMLSVGCGAGSPAPASSSRQAAVAERGASVMPFDLDRTTHQFRKTDTGGVQTVVADNSRDATQVTLVRQHLAAEVDRFRHGDFDDPARIHGTSMPGLDRLRGHAGRITIDYETTPDGGRVTYTTRVPELREALHAWFDAQLSDHGQHATR